jgi:GDP-4-dehydro-6-deoxy-D-mannose reductase
MTGPVLVTGGRGFVGKHLRRELGASAVPADVDVTDVDSVRDVVRRVQPGAVVHLAALSSVEASWNGGTEVWRVNALGTVNVLDAVAVERPSARVLFASTGEVYGRAQEVPTDEGHPVQPLSPYAASKAAAEIACGQRRLADDLDVVVARSFTHVGPGQDERFAVASWASQIARLETSGGGMLLVGDLDVRRDILDVRDVCRAYGLLLDRSVPAGTYNVASGRAVPLRTIVDRLVSLARCRVTVEADESRLRPSEVGVLCGDPSLLERVTGWRPRIPLDVTLADTLEEARRSLAAQGVMRA